jgi:hypothetical protein
MNWSAGSNHQAGDAGDQNRAQRPSGKDLQPQVMPHRTDDLQSRNRGVAAPEALEMLSRARALHSPNASSTIALVEGNSTFQTQYSYGVHLLGRSPAVKPATPKQRTSDP